MSSVFLSYDVVAGHSVAVKILADHLATSREFVNRFYREARLSRLLAHHNLVRGLAAGYDPDARKHYLVLEFIDGPTAHTALLSHGTFPVGVAVKAGIDIARALEFLHTRKYIHRDVKPDNILFHPDGVAKLADLGLAKRLNDDAHLTSVGGGLGTSYYMAYEQSLNADLVDGRSDIFALGATLYHLLTGEVPFPGASHEEIMRGKKRNAFTPVSEINPRVPADLAAIIATTLALNPAGRFQTAGELADALQATGLAAPIPRFGEETTRNNSQPDVPTRTDLKPITLGGGRAPDSRPQANAYLGVTRRVGVGPPPPPRMPLVRRAGVALGLLAGAALAALAAGALSSPRPRIESDLLPDGPKRITRQLPDPNNGAGSLLPSIPR